MRFFEKFPVLYEPTVVEVAPYEVVGPYTNPTSVGAYVPTIVTEPPTVAEFSAIEPELPVVTVGGFGHVPVVNVTPVPEAQLPPPLS